MVLLFVVYTAFVVPSGANVGIDFSNSGLAKAIVVLLFLCYLCYDDGFLEMPLVYITGIIPYSLRSAEIMLYMVSGHSWVIFNRFATPAVMDNIGWRNIWHVGTYGMSRNLCYRIRRNTALTNPFNS